MFRAETAWQRDSYLLTDNSWQDVRSLPGDSLTLISCLFLPCSMFGAGTAWQEIPDRLERNQLSVSLLVTLGKSIEEPVEQCTVVFALIVTEPASESVCFCGGSGGEDATPPPPLPLSFP
jgi:hypothetical protein